MGQVFCCSDRPIFTESTKRNRKEELKIFNDIKRYDFNHSLNSADSFEEFLMRHLTNDLGLPVGPQVAQVFISEFKKFMFLAKMNIQEHQNENLAYASIIDIHKKKKAVKSIVAPPMIDLVWRLMLQHERLYTDF